MSLVVAIVCFLVIFIWDKIDMARCCPMRIFTDEERTRFEKIEEERSKLFGTNKSFKLLCELDDIGIEEQKKRKSIFVTQEEIDNFFSETKNKCGQKK